MYRPCSNCGVKMSECDIDCSFKEAREEIASLKQSLDELQEKYEALEDGAKNAYGLYKEYKDAEQEGLLVRLPCKAGSTVYAYSDFGRAIVPYTVEGIHISENALQISCCWYSHDDCMEGTEFEPSDFGKTVFLTMEEAKQAITPIRTN